jgi:hypothetical protein
MFITVFKRARALHHGGSYLRVLNITERKRLVEHKKAKETRNRNEAEE